MEELETKINELVEKTETLNLKLFGKVGTIIITVISLSTGLMNNSSEVLQVCIALVGMIAIFLSGSMKREMKLILGAFKYAKMLFPLYFLDIIVGVAIGFLVFVITGIFPIIPVILDMAMEYVYNH